MQIEKFNCYLVNDIVCQVSKCAFVLESPHHEEIRQLTPACGQSGITMADHIIASSGNAIGPMLKSNPDLASWLSIMNASSIPLQASCYREHELQQTMLLISESLRPLTKDLEQNKSRIKVALDCDVGNWIVDSFASRLENLLTSSTCEKFVICGVAAQCIFELATDLIGKYREARTGNYLNRQIHFFYENHPSPNSGGGGSAWDKPNALSKLKLFIDCQKA